MNAVGNDAGPQGVGHTMKALMYDQFGGNDTFRIGTVSDEGGTVTVPALGLRYTA